MLEYISKYSVLLPMEKGRKEHPFWGKRRKFCRFCGVHNVGEGPIIKQSLKCMLKASVETVGIFLQGIFQHEHLSELCLGKLRGKYHTRRQIDKFSILLTGILKESDIFNIRIGFLDMKNVVLSCAFSISF